MHYVNNKEEFFDLIKEGHTLVDFYASWCGPCRMLSPIIEEMDEKYDKINVIKIDVDELPDIASLYQVASIPTLLFLKDGQIQFIEVGYRDEEELSSLINKLLQ